MTPAERLAIVRALIDIARPEMLKYYRPDSCIAATRIGIDVLAYFGIGARALCVHCLLFNHGGIQAAKEGRACVGDEWGVGLGFPDDFDAPAASEVGHLVILLDDTVSDQPGDNVSWVDLSLDQADRPHKGIHVVPGVFSAPVRFLTEDDVQADFPQDWGLIAYRRIVNETYKTSPNWKRQRAEKEVTGKVIRAMRAELAEFAAR